MRLSARHWMHSLGQNLFRVWPFPVSRVCVCVSYWSVGMLWIILWLWPFLWWFVLQTPLPFWTCLLTFLLCFWWTKVLNINVIQCACLSFMVNAICTLPKKSFFNPKSGRYSPTLPSRNFIVLPPRLDFKSTWNWLFTGKSQVSWFVLVDIWLIQQCFWEDHPSTLLWKAIFVINYINFWVWF